MENEFSLAYSFKALGEPIKPNSRDIVPSEEKCFFQFLRPSQTAQMFKHLSLWKTFPIQTTSVPNLKPVKILSQDPYHDLVSNKVTF